MTFGCFLFSAAYAASRVRWSRSTHWQCPKDARQAVRARALLLGGRGMPVMNGDVWGVVFSYLIDGEHARRPLLEGAEEGWELVYAD